MGIEIITLLFSGIFMLGVLTGFVLADKHKKSDGYLLIEEKGDRSIWTMDIHVDTNELVKQKSIYLKIKNIDEVV